MMGLNLLAILVGLAAFQIMTTLAILVGLTAFQIMTSFLEGLNGHIHWNIHDM
jgi:hypothetical protein